MEETSYSALTMQHCSGCYTSVLKAWWIQSLQQYDFTVQHQPSPKHGNADALLRQPCLNEACKHCDKLESQEQWKIQDESDIPKVAPLNQSDSVHNKSAHEL